MTAAIIDGGGGTIIMTMSSRNDRGEYRGPSSVLEQLPDPILFMSLLSEARGGTSPDVVRQKRRNGPSGADRV